MRNGNYDTPEEEGTSHELSNFTRERKNAVLLKIIDFQLKILIDFYTPKEHVIQSVRP